MPLFGDPSVWLKDFLMQAGLSSGISLFLSTGALVTFDAEYPLVDKGQAVILRHRASDAIGLPLQVYLFSTGYQMVPYENLQSEIFEHLIVILNEFGLKLFQNPTGFESIVPDNIYTKTE